MARITVTHRHGDSFDIRVRGYALVSDEPVTVGGDDEGPTPTELMVAGLAACAADEVVKCLASLGADFRSTEVTADFSWDAAGDRVSSVYLSINVPGEIDQSAKDAAIEAVLRCPARKMLDEPPTVAYELRGPSASVAASAHRNGSAWPEEPAPDADSEA